MKSSTSINLPSSLKSILYILLVFLLSCSSGDLTNYADQAKTQIAPFYKALEKADGHAIVSLLDPVFFDNTDSSKVAEYFSGWPYGTIDNFQITKAETIHKTTTQKQLDVIEIHCQVKYKDGRLRHDSFLFLIKEGNRLSKIVEYESEDQQ